MVARARGASRCGRGLCRCRGRGARCDVRRHSAAAAAGAPAAAPAAACNFQGRRESRSSSIPTRSATGASSRAWTPEDFEILEEGVPQKVSAVEFVRVEASEPETTRRDPNNLREMADKLADPHRRAFVIYLDTLHTRVEGGAIIRTPLIDMLNRIIAPGDLFGVMVPAMRPSDLTFGARSLSVEEQLQKYWTWGQRDRLIADPTDPIEQRLRSCFHKKVIRKPDGSIDAVDWLVPDGAAVRFFDEILVERHRADRLCRA
jgi:hypothetical protein